MILFRQKKRECPTCRQPIDQVRTEPYLPLTLHPTPNTQHPTPEPMNRVSKATYPLPCTNPTLYPCFLFDPSARNFTLLKPYPYPYPNLYPYPLPLT